MIYGNVIKINEIIFFSSINMVPNFCLPNKLQALLHSQQTRSHFATRRERKWSETIICRGLRPYIYTDLGRSFRSCSKHFLYVCVKGAMSRIARLLSYHSFGDKNSLERQKIPLNQACKYKVLVAFQLLLVSHLD